MHAAAATAAVVDYSCSAAVRRAEGGDSMGLFGTGPGAERAVPELSLVV